jgi:hypothetical protein
MLVRLYGVCVLQYLRLGILMDMYQVGHGCTLLQ